MKSETKEFLSKYDFSVGDAQFICGSALQALSGENSQYGIQSIKVLLDILDRNIPDLLSDIDVPFFMPIEGVYKVDGQGTFLSGRVKKGKFKVGESAEIVGFKQAMKTEIFLIDLHHQNIPEISVADGNLFFSINIKRISIKDIKIGMVLAKPGSVQANRKFKAYVYFMNKEENEKKDLLNDDKSLSFYLDYFPFFNKLDKIDSIKYISEE